VTSREVRLGCRWLREPDAAEAALKGLVKAGFGCWLNSPPTAKGGRPSRVFKLSTASTVNETTTVPEDDVGSVDVDNVDAPQTPVPNDEWGEL